jgi:hypothetical protein
MMLDRSKNGPNLGVRHAGLKIFGTSTQKHLPPGNTYEQYSHGKSAFINRCALNLNAERLSLISQPMHSV